MPPNPYKMQIHSHEVRFVANLLVLDSVRISFAGGSTPSYDELGTLKDDEAAVLASASATAAAAAAAAVDFEAKER